MTAPATGITSRTQYEILRLFAAGKTEREIADYTTVDGRAVTRTVNDLAAGDRETARNQVAAYERRAAAVAGARGTPPPGQPAQPPASPAPDTVAQLLAAASASPSRRVQSLGKKVSGLVDELRAALAREEQAAEAQRRVEELAAELERAREVLRAASGRPARTAPAAATAQPTAPEVPAKTVRAWARQNGVDVPALGRIPRDVMDAYLKANPDPDTEGQ